MEKQISFRCPTCGRTDCFISNEDKSYVKCTNCNRGFLGGIDELKRYNMDYIKEQLSSEVEEDLSKMFQDAFKDNKIFKIK